MCSHRLKTAVGVFLEFTIKKGITKEVIRMMLSFNLGLKQNLKSCKREVNTQQQNTLPPGKLLFHKSR